MSKKMKTWTVETVKLSDVKPFDKNPRQIRDSAFAALTKSIERFGYVDLIVWNKRTGNIVGGHQRYKVLMKDGVKETKMVVVDMSETEELAANITLNNPCIEGDWDDPVAELLNHLEEVDPEFFVDGNMDSLRNDLESIMPNSLDEDTDTQCPCCKHQWNISDKNVKIITEKKQNRMIKKMEKLQQEEIQREIEDDDAG